MTSYLSLFQDGGQLVFVLLELIAGRPVPRKIKDVIIGLAFRLALPINTPC